MSIGLEVISMSHLNELAMEVQAQQIRIAEDAGVDSTLLKSEHWLMQLITETAIELKAKGVSIVYE